MIRNRKHSDMTQTFTCSDRVIELDVTPDIKQFKKKKKHENMIETTVFRQWERGSLRQ